MVKREPVLVKIILKNLNIASWLTVLRLLMLPFIILPVTMDWEKKLLIAAVFLVFAGITDIFDGWIARRSAGITDVGTYRDFVVDKIFICMVLFFLNLNGLIALWIPIIITSREVIILAVRMLGFRGKPPAPDFGEKLKLLFLSSQSD